MMLSDDLRAVNTALYMLSLKIVNAECDCIINNIRANIASISEQVQALEENCLVQNIPTQTPNP